jgi:uncharacterized protein (DUF2062 family)
MLKTIWSTVWGLVLEQLKQGLAPEQAAWACALGGYLALIPILGVVTVLCIAVAWGLRLNQVVIHAAASLAHPLQFLLLIPFCALGARVFDGPYLDLNLRELLVRIRHSPLDVIQHYGKVGLHGVVVWAAFGPLIVPPLYFVFRGIFRRFLARNRA